MSDYIVNKKNLLNQRGVLIESDAGFISPIDSRNTPFINEIKKLDSGVRISNDEPLVVYVVLQKYAVKNRNGRIYPESILRREVEKYQQVIRERRAVGECVPAGTEIFTKNGWVDIKDVSIGDDVYTLNLDTNQIEIQKVYDTIKKHYDDDLVHIYNKGTLDMKLTKNHKMVLWDRNNKPYEMTAIEFYDSMIKGDSRLSHSKINYGEHFELMGTNIVSNIILNDVNVELEKFNDDVYCVSVPNKTWLMRYNNQVAWTHNCDHPETSIIAADRISHNILETWWEGKTLMGKMEVLMSPGYINYGIVSTKGDEVANLLRNNIMIGVSSRGLGSLREVSGDLIVQDDFEIICWDVVTAPSTPGSWIFGEKSEARPFVESVEGKNNLLIDGLDKFLLD
jgi:hypothetical protein